MARFKKPRFSGSYKHKSIVEPLQAAQDKAIKDKLKNTLFGTKQPNMLTKRGKDRRLELMRELGHALANRYTAMIREKFDELNVNYVPLMINYVETQKMTGLRYKGGEKKGERITVPKHNITIGLDYDFVRSVNNRKISYHTWLIRYNPEIGRRYRREVIRGLSRKEQYDSTPQWEIGGRLWNQYKKEVPEEDQAMNFIDHDAGGISKKGYVRGEFVIANMYAQSHGTLSAQERMNKKNARKHGNQPIMHKVPKVPKHKDYPAGDSMRVNMQNIDKFLENERYLFGGNLNKFLTSKLGTAEYKDIDDILTSVLGEFKKDLEKIARHFVEKDWEELAQHPDKNKRTGITKKYKHDAKTRSQWKYKPKFPNINSILWWFINDKDGMASSTKLQEFSNLKTVKAKANWIDRAVFLIANGVYAKKLGHKRGLTPTGRQKKYGKAATIKHAQKFKRDSEDPQRVALKPYNARNRKLSDWRKITAAQARGLSQPNKKNNPTSRKDNRKDNR